MTNEVFNQQFMHFLDLPLSEVVTQVNVRLKRRSDRQQFNLEIQDKPSAAIKAIAARAVAEQADRDAKEQEELRLLIERRSYPPVLLADEADIILIEVDEPESHPTREVPECRTVQIPMPDVYVDTAPTIRRMPSVRPDEEEPYEEIQDMKPVSVKDVPSSVRIHEINNAGRYSLPKEEMELPARLRVEVIGKIKVAEKRFLK